MKNPLFHADGSMQPRSFLYFNELTISVFLEELFTTSIVGAGIMFTPRYPPLSRVFTKVNPGPQYNFSDGSIQIMAVTKQVYSSQSPFYGSMLFWYLPQGFTIRCDMEHYDTERYSIISPSPTTNAILQSDQPNLLGFQTYQFQKSMNRHTITPPGKVSVIPGHLNRKTFTLGPQTDITLACIFFATVWS